MTTHVTNPKPAPWYILRARKLVATKAATKNMDILSKQYLSGSNDSTAAMKAFADYIKENEEPPVDPDLIMAREIISERYRNNALFNLANKTKEGVFDKTEEIQLSLFVLKQVKKKTSNNTTKDNLSSC